MQDLLNDLRRIDAVYAVRRMFPLQLTAIPMELAFMIGGNFGCTLLVTYLARSF